MIIFITSTILILSILGIMVILFPKIPILVRLPAKPKRENLNQDLARKIKNSLFKKFSYEIFLEKILSKIKILTLRTENKTSDLLQKLREKYKRKRENDNYWEDIKKATKDK